MGMETFGNGPVGPTINDVLVEIHTLEQKFTAEGNKDVEPSILNDVRRQLTSREITPEQARRQIYALDSSRIER